MSVRSDERADLEGEEKELVDTVDTLDRALVVLKCGQTFMQSKSMSADLQKIATGLKSIIQATWVNAKQKAMVQSLLQSEDEDLSLQPQASTAAFTSQGGGILDMLGELKTEAEDSLSTTRKSEMESSHKFEMLKMSLETELKNMKERLSDATNERSGEEQSKASNMEELAETQKSLAADEAYLAELNQSCSAKAKEWAARQKQASEEQAAIEKAKEILTEGVKAFLQVSSHHRNKVDDVKLTQVSKLLKALSMKNHKSYALAPGHALRAHREGDGGGGEAPGADQGPAGGGCRDRQEPERGDRHPREREGGIHEGVGGVLPVGGGRCERDQRAAVLLQQRFVRPDEAGAGVRRLQHRHRLHDRRAPGGGGVGLHAPVGGGDGGGD